MYNWDRTLLLLHARRLLCVVVNYCSISTFVSAFFSIKFFGEKQRKWVKKIIHIFPNEPDIRIVSFALSSLFISPRLILFIHLKIRVFSLLCVANISQTEYRDENHIVSSKECWSSLPEQNLEAMLL
jgi:hypothetical protein